ncbi:unnamed protein product [Heterobilharzia americana]|nr:unnamed protein product [Heterobilharzia americana]
MLAYVIRTHQTTQLSELETISILDINESSFVSSTKDQLFAYQQALENWLRKAVIHTFAKFSSNHRSFESVTRIVGLPTSLACALSYYIPEFWKNLSIDDKLDQVCLDHYLSLLTVLDTSTNSNDVANVNLNIESDLFNDDCENVERIVNLLQRLSKPLYDLQSLLVSITRLLNQYPKRSINERIGIKQNDDLCLVISIYQLISKVSISIGSVYHSSTTAVSSTTTATITTTAASPTCTTSVSVTSTNSNQSDILQSNYTCHIQNGVLRDLVRISGIVAKPARPAHPSNQPIPVVNQSTVDQLVSSSTSSFSQSKDMSNCNNSTTTSSNTCLQPDESIHSTFNNRAYNDLAINNEENQNINNITNDKTSDLLNDIARVALNRSLSTPCKDAASNDVRETKPQQDSRSSTNGHYYLNQKFPLSDCDNSINVVYSNHSTTGINTTDTITATADDNVRQPFTRNSLYATFNKRPTPCLSNNLPSIGSLSQPNNPMKRMGTKSPRVNSVTDINLSQVTLPSLRSEFEKRKRSLSSVTPADVAQLSKVDNDLPSGKTTWKVAGTSRLQAHKVSDGENAMDNSISSTSEKSDQETAKPGRAAALRLSLEQRRRAIEVSRQRERLATTKATAERNNAAFVKLLQERFHQRRNVTAEDSQLPNGVVSESEVASTVVPASPKEPEKLDRGLIDSECMQVMTDTDQITVPASQIGQATDLDEDFSMLSSSTVPNVNEPLQDSSVFMETSQTIAVLEDSYQSHESQPNESVASSPKSPQVCHSGSQVYDSPSLVTKHSKHHDVTNLNNHRIQNYHSTDRRSSVSCQRSDSDESDYLPSNVSAPHMISPTPPSWHQSLPYQRKKDTKRPKSRYSERESTPQPESFIDMNNQQPHKGSKYRRYVDKTYSGHPAYNSHSFVPVDSFHSIQSPSFRRHHISHKVRQYDTLQNPEQRILHKHMCQKHHRPHIMSNQTIQSGDYCECISDEESSETAGDSNYTYDDHSYPYVNRMAYSGRFSHRSLSRLAKPHSKNRYKSNGRKSTDYAYDVEELEVRPHSPAGSYASSRGMTRGPRIDINSLGYGNNHSITPIVDPVTLDQINRNMSDLRSGFERLSMQQQVLLASSSATTAAALVASSFQNQQQPPVSPVSPLYQAQGLSTSISNISTTRATWSDRPIVRDLSVQRDIHSSLGINNNSVVTSGCNEPRISNEPLVKDGDNDPAISNEPSHDDHSNENKECPIFVSVGDTSNSSTAPSNPSPVEISQKQVRSPLVSANNANPEGKLFFIEFQEPDPERMQRTRDRLEARRATERAMVAEQLEALRTTGRKEKEAADRAQYERKLNEKERREAVLQAHLSKKEATVSPGSRNNNPYPVRSGSSALSKSEINLSSTTPRRSSSKKPLITPKRDRNAPVASSLDTFPSSNASSRVNSAKSKVLPPATTRGSGDGEALDTNAEPDCDSSSFREKKSRTIRNRPVNGGNDASRKASTPLSSGISLSSLHRLGASESLSSGPGLPVQCLNQPRLFVKPKAKSNRTVVVNAISHCCLAGTVNEPTKQLALKELAATEGTHFMILFRDSRCQYRAVYSFDLESEELRIICGNGPRRITHEMVNRFFKYNSGAKQFTEITSTKHLSPVVDAVTIHDALWNKSGGAHTILPSQCS